MSNKREDPEDIKRQLVVREYQLEVALRALRWYSQCSNWSRDDWGVPSVVVPPDYGNPGGKARRAIVTINRIERKEPHQ